MAQFFQSEEELNDLKCLRQIKCKELKIEIQPYCAFIGDPREDKSSHVKVFVVVDEFSYQIRSNSILDGVDICFKIFFILKTGFPKECRSLWMFLQRYVYQINLKDLKEYKVVSDFILERGKKYQKPVSEEKRIKKLRVTKDDELVQTLDVPFQSSLDMMNV